MISGYKEGIAFYNLFDLFKNLLIILITCNSFQYSNNKNLEIIIKVNSESMWITIFLNMFLGATIQYIKIFCLKLFKTDLNINPKFIIFDIFCYVEIKLMYNPFIE